MKKPLPSQPFLHTTPAAALTTTVDRLVTLDLPDRPGHRFQISCPTSIDELLDHPATHEAFEADEYMPYWAELWPAALMLGEAIAGHDWPPATDVLEVGCGLGLSGIVALALGLKVTFSDYDATALEFARRNAIANGYGGFHTLLLDWRYPPQDRQFSLVLGADVIYEARNIQPLLGLLDRVLTNTGECWLADPDRPHRQEFYQAAQQRGWHIEAAAKTLERPGQTTVRGTVYRLRRL